MKHLSNYFDSIRELYTDAGLTKVIYKGQVMVAQYGQWDHYLDGQGKTVQEFLKTLNRNEFLTNLELSNYITDKEVDTILEDRPNFDNYEDESAWYELVAAEFLGLNLENESKLFYDRE